MSYQKHDFKFGNILLASQLNEMDEQIEKNSEIDSELSDSSERPLQNKIIATLLNTKLNKKYSNSDKDKILVIDDNGNINPESVIVPNYYNVILNLDGTVNTYDEELLYLNVKENITTPWKSDYLDVLWGNSHFYAKCVEIIDFNNGDLKFIGDVEYNGIQRYIVFTLDSNNVLTTTNIVTFENVINKVQSVINNSTSTVKYPSTKAIFDEFQRKPVTIWEVDGETITTGLTALEVDMSANPSWQLTNLDFSPYKRVKIYTKASQGSGTTASTSTTPSFILEMSLDPRAAISAYGGHYLASNVIQKSNDRNRLCTICCAISSDKTSFVVLRMTNLYGTAATNNSDVGGYVFKIEGYYD